MKSADYYWCVPRWTELVRRCKQAARGVLLLVEIGTTSYQDALTKVISNFRNSNAPKQ